GGKERDHALARLGEAEDSRRGEIAALAAELERAVRQHDAADRRGRDLQARLEALGAEVDSLRQSQAQLREQLAAREQEVEAARDAALKARDRLSSAQSDWERRSAAEREAAEQVLFAAQLARSQEKERLQAELARTQS